MKGRYPTGAYRRRGLSIKYGGVSINNGRGEDVLQCRDQQCMRHDRALKCLKCLNAGKSERVGLKEAMEIQMYICIFDFR